MSAESSGNTATEQREVVWCQACGIPHKAGAVYCSFCSQPLVPLDEHPATALTTALPLAATTPAPAADEAPDETAAAAPPTDEDPEKQTGALARAIAAHAAEGRAPRQMPAVRWPMPRRPIALSEEEIEAKAAAIVALARAEEAAGIDATPRPRAPGDDLLNEEGLSPEVGFIPPLRERDKLWLIVGLFGCAILILAAVALVRVLAG